MREDIIRLTRMAICDVNHSRFFQSERGFQGRFLSALQSRIGELIPDAILEQEYQKSSRHGLSQRPDIIYHVPAGISRRVQDGNIAVWALKLNASRSQALEDFSKLDEMFSRLGYELGFFLNIESDDSMRSLYNGIYAKRLITLAVRFKKGVVFLID